MNLFGGFVDNNFLELTLFITGPTYVRSEVKKAALLPEFGHRDSENEKRFKPIFENLKKIWGANEDYEVLVINGSGSNAMETSVRSLVNEDETVLNVSVGAFGDLFHKIAKRNLKHGMKAEQLKFEPGKSINLIALEKALKQYNPNVVTLTHNETSTGVVNPIVDACKIIREYGAMPLVDGVSIFGAAPTPITEMNAAMYSTSTQKGIALDAGFGLAIYSKEAMEKAKQVPEHTRGYTTDLVEQAKSAAKFQVLTTPSSSLANQLWHQLNYIVNVEGIENRFKRHEEMKKMAHEFIEEELPGFELFPDKEHASPTVTCIKVPAYFTKDTLKAVKNELKEKGYLFDAGYGKLNDVFAEQGNPLTIRIGHMGDITPEMLKEYLNELKFALISHLR